MDTVNGALVVELLTRSHRLGFTLRYCDDGVTDPQVLITHDDHGAPHTLEPELQTIVDELVTWKPDVLAVLARTCTRRGCIEPTWQREYGTDLAWCRPHGGIRGLQLLREERPDLFPTEEPDGPHDA